MGVGKGDVVIITIAAKGLLFWTVSLVVALWVRSDEKRTDWRIATGAGGLWQACGFNPHYQYIPHVSDPVCIGLADFSVAGWVHTVQGFACAALILMLACLVVVLLTARGCIHYDVGYPALTLTWLLAGLMQIIALGVFATHFEQGERFYAGVDANRSVTVRTYLAWPFYLAGAVAGVWNFFSLCLISAAIIVMFWQQRSRQGRALKRHRGSPLGCDVEQENLSGEL